MQTLKMKAIFNYLSAPAPSIAAGAAAPGAVLAWQFSASSGGGVENSADGGKNRCGSERCQSSCRRSTCRFESHAMAEPQWQQILLL
jgi:hypothetical protein